jgi:hypothetical protein
MEPQAQPLSKASTEELVKKLQRTKNPVAMGPIVTELETRISTLNPSQLCLLLQKGRTRMTGICAYSLFRLQQSRERIGYTLPQKRIYECEAVVPDSAVLGRWSEKRGRFPPHCQVQSRRILVTNETGPPLSQEKNYVLYTEKLLLSIKTK